MASHIGRRKFLATLGGAAAAWPLAAGAQQAELMRRIAFLHSLAENDPEVQGRIAAFRRAFEALGWTEKRNVQIEHRFSAGDFTRMQAYTTELVNSAPDLILATSTPVVATQSADRALLSRLPSRIRSGCVITRRRSFGNTGARRSGDTGSSHRLCTAARWRPDRPTGTIHQHPSWGDYCIGAAAPPPCNLWLSAVCDGRRADILWTGHHRHLPAFGFVC